MSDKLNQKIDIYKTYVETAQKISEQRCKINNVFMTFNIGLIGLQSFVSVTILVLFAIFINFVWISHIKTYKILNEAKFQVINIIENDLPYSPFKDEYEILKNNQNYLCTSNERKIPIILIIFYLIGLIWYQLKEIICFC